MASEDLTITCNLPIVSVKEEDSGASRTFAGSVQLVLDATGTVTGSTVTSVNDVAGWRIKVLDS